MECQGCYSTSFNPQPFWRTEEEVATVCNENDDCIETAVIYKPNHLAFFEARVRMVQGPAGLDSAAAAAEAEAEAAEAAAEAEAAEAEAAAAALNAESALFF